MQVEKIFQFKDDKKRLSVKILELGCGTALPGVLAALCDANVTLTDGEQFENCLKNARKICEINGLGDNVNTSPLTWGSFSKTLLEMPKFDFILGSDCFYDPKDFDAILCTVAFLLDRNPTGEFWSTYQERSADWSIELLLQKWNLVCRHVPFSSFSRDFMNVEKTSGSLTSVQMLVICHYDCASSDRSFK
ncbi:probable methyltransferase-like protein 23 isoform X2 [Xenia sp. Carnegie-2017]|uniref:probable methyltransferase-like protein 23 isoform X2 n=1 Tax=Xenia sp. Carnegie-2017 TaxID=2897299 RepID=UPI001F04ABF3|nr:probable methyltransferase-like protein 23 isoform X2 [Xenia sp. Carnegie-2017]